MIDLHTENVILEDQHDNIFIFYCCWHPWKHWRLRHRWSVCGLLTAPAVARETVAVVAGFALGFVGARVDAGPCRLRSVLSP